MVPLNAPHEDDPVPSAASQGGAPIPGDRLDALRLAGDEPADAAVAALVAGAAPDEVRARLRALVSDLRGLHAVPEVRAWVDEVVPRPTWVDGRLVRDGQGVFNRWSLDIVTALFCASLPFAYAAAQGVEVLEQVSQLAEHGTVARRIAETGQMLVDISRPGGLDDTGVGYRVLRMVRLLHGAIRATLLAPGAVPGVGPAWDVAHLGVPVNQEDLLGTLLSFTTVVFRALDRMGIALTPAQRGAYLQLWGLVGHLLGITTAGDILDDARAEELTDAIAHRLQAPSAAGRHLMGILMSEMELSMPWGLGKLPRTLVRYLLGADVSDMLGVAPRAPWWPVLGALARANRAVGGLPGGTRVLQAPSRMVGRAMIRLWIDRTIVGATTTPLRLDPALLRAWGVGSAPTQHTLGLRGRLRRRRAQARRRRLVARGAPVAAEAAPTAGAPPDGR